MTPTFWSAPELTLLFNIYMRLLDEGVYLHLKLPEQCHACPISVLELSRVRMGCNGLRLKKTEWFWVFGPSGDKTFPILTLDRVALLRQTQCTVWTHGCMASARIASGSCAH